jgi:nucleoside diphosphate kinase
MRRVLDTLRNEGFVILKAENNVMWDKQQAAAFYAPHAGKWYLNRLVVSPLSRSTFVSRSLLNLTDLILHWPVQYVCGTV